MQYSHTKKEISILQPESDKQSNNLILRSQNLKYLNTLSLANAYSFDITPWWELQSNVTAQYQIAETGHLQNNATIEMYSANFNLVNMVKLPGNFSIELSGFYQSKSIFGISQFLPLGSLNAGIQKKFASQGTLRLSMDDIFRTNYWRINTYAPDNNLNTRVIYDWHNQFIRLTYTRNLGNNKLRSVKLQSGSDEERGRVTN